MLTTYTVGRWWGNRVSISFEDWDQLPPKFLYSSFDSNIIARKKNVHQKRHGILVRAQTQSYVEVSVPLKRC